MRSASARTSPAKVALRDFFFASWIGMMPGTVMCVYAVGLPATVAVTVYVTRPARAALARPGAAA